MVGLAALLRDLLFSAMYAISAMAKRSVSITRSPLRLPVRYGMKGPIVALAPMMHAAVAAMIAARNKRASPNARAISKKPSFSSKNSRIAIFYTIGE